MPAAGEYTLETRIASQTTGGAFHIERDGQNLTGSVTVPVTGGWQSWQTVESTVTLEPGVQTLRFVKDGATGEFNVNWFELSGSHGCPADLAEPYGSLNIFDVTQYIALYNAEDPAADLAEPFGAFNVFDITAYIAQYNAGCP